MCESSGAIRGPSASDPYVTCFGSESKCDADHSARSPSSFGSGTRDGTGVDKIWPDHKTDDEDSTEDPRTFASTLTHGARPRPDGLDNESADVTRSAQNSRPTI